LVSASGAIELLDVFDSPGAEIAVQALQQRPVAAEDQRARAAQRAAHVLDVAGRLEERHAEPEHRTLAELGAHADLAVHQLDQALADDQPRPVPPCNRVVDASACENGWNSLAAASGAMPMPLSLTTNMISLCVRVSLRLPTWTMTAPRGVNLIALLTRFVSTCRSRTGSPRTSTRHARVDVDAEAQMLGFGVLVEQALDRIERLAQVQRDRFEHELARLDLRVVEMSSTMRSSSQGDLYAVCR
jgi:hypothetical protein